MVGFILECVKCGSSKVEIQDVGGRNYQLVCLKCGNWEEHDEA